MVKSRRGFDHLVFCLYFPGCLHCCSALTRRLFKSKLQIEVRNYEKIIVSEVV